MATGNEDVLERIESKLDQMLKLAALHATSRLKQTQAIQLLSAAGFERKLIASLLETTPNTVSVTLSTSKSKRKSTRSSDDSSDK